MLKKRRIRLARIRMVAVAGPFVRIKSGRSASPAWGSEEGVEFCAEGDGDGRFGFGWVESRTLRQANRHCRDESGDV